MTANELRIGNKTSNGIVVNIFEDHFFTKVGDTAYNSKYHPAEPIPLTEEWLLKFGFEKYKYGHNTYRQKSFIIEEGLLKKSPYEFRKRISKEDSLGLAYVKYVHQLQNLYFALTGEELNFKSE